MRAVVTRVSEASVKIDGEIVGKIGRGFLILLGVGPEDTPADCRKLAEKILGLRIFTDENDKMNLSLEDVSGQVLVVSQFTLYGNVRKGRRPSFTGAAAPSLAIPLYEQFLSECERLGFPPQHGCFGADMKVASVNDGPVTLVIDSAELA
ncbi:MAG: D-aminoacyl-tRNA deacylase [Clostridia bacterium]|nr:D-aminoacyl-tRNA deacylase [Clostridia bacterium]